ncbi:hypothetical protein MNBD_GAMMA10-3024 [hydrothermal vent metagenome]|uniref:MPN domain-containing protein n=1 Tax=hydrothermal vent metagenome TaxID=652676 RepID=A0A3B0XR97_9ZZZZ
MKQTLSIPRTLANRLLSLAQNTPDTEICGLISQSKSPHNKPQYRVYPIHNIATKPHCVFEMQPRQQIQAFKSIREADETLFAVFHSHPHSAALPSEKDLNDAAYTDALNLIISLGTQGVLDMRGYFYRKQGIEAVELVIS